MNKIKQKLQARAKFNKGKRVGYAKGRPVVDRETGELLEDFKPAPKPTPAPAPTQHLLQQHQLIKEVIQVMLFLIICVLLIK
jgi:hypothetical protein